MVLDNMIYWVTKYLRQHAITAHKQAKLNNTADSCQTMTMPQHGFLFKSDECKSTLHLY